MTAIRLDNFMLKYNINDRNIVFRLKYYGLVKLKKYHDYWYVYDEINVNNRDDNPILPTFDEVIHE